MLKEPVFRAVIFDMDGVLVDTEPLHYRINQMVLRELGFELPYDYYKQFIGSTNTHMWNTVIRDYGLQLTPEELNGMAGRMKEEILAKEGYPKISGTGEFVESLKRAGFLLAVASSSAPEMIEKMIRGVGIYHYFDCLVSGETVARPKPAPDVFLKAAAALHVLPEECLVIEDSENGTRAAKAAGMACLGFLNPGSGEQDLSAADYLFRSYEGIDAAFARMVFARHHGIPLCIAETERLMIRELKESDFDALWKLQQEEDIRDYVQPMLSKDEAGREFFRSYIRNAYPFFGYGYYALIEKATGQLAGEAGFSHTGDLGYAVSCRKRRRGYALEALKAILSYAEKYLGFEQVRCVIHKENSASIALVKRLGFQQICTYDGETSPSEREEVVYARFFEQ